MSIFQDSNKGYLVFTVLLYVLLAMISLITVCEAQTTLPAPPQIGSTTLNRNDPISYLTSSIKYIIFIGLGIVVILAILGFSGGLISEVNEARKKGEWGRFAVYFGAGILVILVVIFGAWWGSERLSTLIT